MLLYWTVVQYRSAVARVAIGLNHRGKSLSCRCHIWSGAGPPFYRYLLRPIEDTALLEAIAKAGRRGD